MNRLAYFCFLQQTGKEAECIRVCMHPFIFSFTKGKTVLSGTEANPAFCRTLDEVVKIASVKSLVEVSDLRVLYT